jgi:enamine deaminase RidA (YjgF/YER057c/UK114 family)
MDPGRPVENPRQVPAYSYSTRYGPLPPCFARATVVPDPGSACDARLLVGGTASIVGEDSRHDSDAARQAIETFANLAHLLAAATGRPAGGVDEQGPLDAFTDVRVYVVRVEDAARVRELVRSRFSPDARVEFAQADLCRRELLVEIEGLACL